MFNRQSQYVVTDCISDVIMKSVFGEIRSRQLIERMPQLLKRQIVGNITENIGAMILPPTVLSKSQESKYRGMREQGLEDVINNGKDSLMPKGVEKQSQIDTYNLDQSNFMSALQNKKMGQSKRSSKKSSLIASMNKTNKTSNFSVNTTSKRVKKQNLYVSLNAENDAEDDDPYFVSIKKKKQLEMKQRQRHEKSQEQRKKHFLERQEQFDTKFDNKQYTFDFQGSVLGSQVQNQQKIKYNSVKMRLASIDRRNQANLKLNEVKQTEVHVKSTNKRKSLYSNIQSTEGIQMAVNIPVFDTSASHNAHFLGLPTQRGSCRLKQYKKYYGGRFTRLQKQVHNTVDLKTYQQEEQDLFKSTRYFKDQKSSLNRSLNTQKSLDSPERRLALPKIKGKYSTLDRYNYN